MAETSLPDYSNLWASAGDKLQPTVSKIGTGWEVEIPPRQWFNWLDNRQDQAIQHIAQHGIASWSAVIEYQANKSYVQGSNGVIYVCKATNTNNNPVNDTGESYWRSLSSEFALSNYGTEQGTVNNYTVTYTPTVNALRDGMILRFVASSANTGASTFTPFGASSRPLVGQAQQPLQGGEILAGSRCTIVYNQSISSWVLLNATGGALQVPSPSAGLHAVNQARANFCYGTPVGTMRKGAFNITAPTSSSGFSADEIVVASTLGGQTFRLSNFGVTINLGTTGVNGMDTGTVPTSGYVALYAIYSPTLQSNGILAQNCTNTVATEVYTGSAMPAGYTASALISVWRIANSQFVVGFQNDRRISTGINTPLTVSGFQSTYTSFSIASCVPMNARSCHGYFYGTVNNTAYFVQGTVASARTQANDPVGVTSNTLYGQCMSFFDAELVNTQTLHYIYVAQAGATAGGFSVFISGYTI